MLLAGHRHHRTAVLPAALPEEALVALSVVLPYNKVVSEAAVHIPALQVRLVEKLCLVERVSVPALPAGMQVLGHIPEAAFVEASEEGIPEQTDKDMRSVAAD